MISNKQLVQSNMLIRLIPVVMTLLLPPWLDQPHYGAGGTDWSTWQVARQNHRDHHLPLSRLGAIWFFSIHMSGPDHFKVPAPPHHRYESSLIGFSRWGQFAWSWFTVDGVFEPTIGHKKCHQGNKNIDTNASKLHICGVVGSDKIIRWSSVLSLQD